MANTCDQQAIHKFQCIYIIYVRDLRSSTECTDVYFLFANSDNILQVL